MIPPPPRSTLFPYTTLFRSIPGLFQNREYRRYYPSGEVTAHVLGFTGVDDIGQERSEEHTSELQSHSDLVCRLLLEKKKKTNSNRMELAETGSQKLRIGSAD